MIKRSSDLIEETASRLDENLAAIKHQLDALIVARRADGVLTALEAHIGEEKTRGQHLGQIDRDAGFKVTTPVDEFYLARVNLARASPSRSTAQPARSSSARSIRRSRTASSRSTWPGRPPRRPVCAAARRWRASSATGRRYSRRDLCQPGPSSKPPAGAWASSWSSATARLRSAARSSSDGVPPRRWRSSKDWPPATGSSPPTTPASTA